MNLADLTKLTAGSRGIYVDAEIKGLDRIGKKMEREVFVFPMPENSLYGKDKKVLAANECKKHIPIGWTSDDYYGSQNSFFYEDKKEFARVNIRRWVDEEGDNE
jgi:hypothetical protein